jgi:hypothetical protein
VGEGREEAGVELAQRCPQFLEGFGASPDGVLRGASQDGNRLCQLAIGREPAVGVGVGAQDVRQGHRVDVVGFLA